MAFDVISYILSKKYTDEVSGGSVALSQDYNDLKNVPTKNLVGTLSAPLILGNLSSGVYRITGNYYINESDSTCYVDASGVNTFFVSNDSSSILKITSNGISLFVKEDNLYVEKTFVTKQDVESALKEIIAAIPTKVSQLENDLQYVKKSDMDAKIKKQIDENVEKIETSEIDSLFL